MLSDKLNPFIKRYDELSDLLCSSEVISDVKKMTELSKEQSSIQKVYDKAKEYKAILDEIEDAKAMLGDADMGDLAKEELKELEPKIEPLEEEIKTLLLPRDPNDDRNTIIELRAGAGGDEAAIFVGNLFTAYTRYAELNGWKIEILSASASEPGGYKEIIALIKGDQVYSKMKYEGGTHRVQRVPTTESQGRVHTSAITVAIMAEVDDVEVTIDPNDLKIDVMRSSGCGGQSVNTTDSAVRITHLPTGIVVTNQDQKSQHKNKEKAMKVLKARIYDLQMSEAQAKDSDARSSQVGTGDRSGRIRTYNYPQNRISDHRITLTLYRLNEIMSGGLFDEIIDNLIADAQSKLIEAAGF
ncbi:MAG: peptide chain release factor 1 [Campylobacterota bacterium]|nr:peptide chain release factor 1 [Campylobacterota bacterium]